jgi:TPP-dependent pyruvate/acetoin dehydrogenase alpha subunit
MSLDKGEGNRLIPLIQHFPHNLVYDHTTYSSKEISIMVTQTKVDCENQAKKVIIEEKMASDLEVDKITKSIMQKYDKALNELAK